MDVNVALSVGLPAIGALVWLIRLEGRVNTNEAIQHEIRDDVRYLRERIDRALNGKKDDE